MKLLNLGCGAARPPFFKDGYPVPDVPLDVETPWINIDNLHEILSKGTPAREQLDKEPNYINADLRDGLPFEDDTIDGILASHFLEHLDAQESLVMLSECRRVLIPGGILRVSVPDAVRSYHLLKNGCDDWGEPNGDAPRKDFLEFAILFSQHKQVLDAYSLYCLFHGAKYSFAQEMPYGYTHLPPLADLDNRPIFSIFMEARK